MQNNSCLTLIMCTHASTHYILFSKYIDLIDIGNNTLKVLIKLKVRSLKSPSRKNFKKYTKQEYNKKSFQTIDAKNSNFDNSYSHNKKFNNSWLLLIFFY